MGKSSNSRSKIRLASLKSVNIATRPWRIFERINPEKLGTPPGTPIHVGAKPSFIPFITATRFSEYAVTEWIHLDLDQLPAILEERESSVVWVDVEGVHDVSLVSRVGNLLGLHSLTSEDLVNCHLRPQFESYPGYFFFALKMIYLAPEDPARPTAPRTLISEHVSLVLKGRTLCTFQEKPGDTFGRIRDRIRTKTGKVRSRGADHLLYTLLDAVVDGYLQVVDHLAEQIEVLEDEMRSPTSKGPRDSHLTRIYQIKREILWLRKTIYPVRDLLSKVQVEESVFQENTKLYLKDLSQHITQVTDSLSLSMEMIAVLVDTWHSLTNQKMNAIMKTLTMISTVFLPLNFIAGVYGMNFRFMPELEKEYGYPLVLAAMGAVGLAIIGFFISQGWLWEKREKP
jgi:magnesium transporter